MNHISQVNYQEVSSIAKDLHTEGDDLVQLHSQTRQRVSALKNEWVGESAEAFYEAMESELLPALRRVSGALFLSEEILNKVVRIIFEADEKTAQYFGPDFGSNLSGILPGGVTGDDDFGFGGSKETILPQPGGQPGVEPGVQPGSDPAQIGGGTENAGATVPPVENIKPDSPPTMDSSATETPPAEATASEAGQSASGGGGGGGADSQGLQGDLRGLGTGVGGMAQVFTGAGESAPAFSDHPFVETAAGTAGSGAPQAGPQGGGAGSGQEQASGGPGAAAAAAAAGLLGAAAAAAKVLKQQQSDE